MGSTNSNNLEDMVSKNNQFSSLVSWTLPMFNKSVVWECKTYFDKGAFLLWNSGSLFNE